VFPIRVPAVRERREDIEHLVKFFAEMVCKEYACDLRFKDQALQALFDYSWPGNVREMENLVERLAIISSRGLVDVNNLAPYIGPVKGAESAEHICATGSLAHTEKMRIQGALHRNRGIQSKAAGELGITLRQIGYKIKKHGLQDDVERAKAGS